MLEQVLCAVNESRITHLIKQLTESSYEWQPRIEPPLARPVRDPLEQLLFEQDVARVAAIKPAGSRPAVISSGHYDDQALSIVTYDSPIERERVSYVIGKRAYMKAESYATARKNLFYVHVPSWASIRSVTQQELGEQVLGTANLVTGEIRLLDSLDPTERTEVLLHETMHLLYPLHTERQVRDLVRTVMGKQYCHFH